MKLVRGRHPAWLFLYSLLAMLLCLPLAALIYLSLTQQWSFPALLDATFTLDNWRAAMGGTQDLVGVLVRSVGISVTVATACTVGGFWISRHVCYHPKSRWLLMLAYYPYLIAPVILGVMLRYYFIKLGISGTVTGVWIAQFLFIFPYTILFFAGFWTARIREMEGQATTLGAGGGQLFWRLLLPAGREWLYICFFQTLMFSWFEYGMTQLVGIGKVPTLTLRTMQFVKEANPHFAAVSACLLVLPLLGFALLNRKLLYRNTEDHD